VRCGLDFHEAQQSRQYNIVKQQGGYYKADTEGNPDAAFEKVIEERMTNATFLESEETLVNKYMPSLEHSDPIIEALMSVCKASNVTDFELLDSRWNGNEVLRYNTDKGPFFVKMNRVEDKSVLMSEAVSLTSLMRTETIKVPKPLHVGPLPEVGGMGPGCFLVAEYLPLAPFGAMRPNIQTTLGEKLADLHLSTALDGVHKGRFGFVVNNFLSLTPVNNTWDNSWASFFSRKLRTQLALAYKDKAYGRAALNASDDEFRELGEVAVNALGKLLGGMKIRPSLLHGDLWIGNTGATQAGEAVAFDPACFFGHSEFDLAITAMFGGYTERFYDAYHEKLPKEEGFEDRETLYQLFHYLNQLNLFGDPHVRAKCVELMKELQEKTKDA